MLGSQEHPELEKPWKIMQYVWLIHVLILIIALAICAIVQPTIERESESNLGIVPYVFAGVLFVSLAQMYLMRRAALSTKEPNSILKQFQMQDFPLLPIKNSTVKKYATVSNI